MARTRMFGVAVAAAVAFGLASHHLIAADEPANPAPQPTGNGVSVRGSGLALLRAEVVAKDLELTDDQTAAIKKLDDEARKQLGDLRDALKDATREERRAKLVDAEKEIAKKVDAVLNEKQRARLQEIRLQVLGPAALADKEVADALKLNDDQTKKLAELSATRRTDVRAAIAAAGGDRNAAREKIAQAVKDAADKMLDVLTAEQKESFEKMQGQKLDLGKVGFGSLGGGGRRTGGAGAKPEATPEPKDSK